MIYQIKAEPAVWHASVWEFTWDDEAGTVTGPSAAEVLEMASWRGIVYGPRQGTWGFSAEPLKSKTDMAAIVGYEHRLPPELIGHYPKAPPLPRHGFGDWVDVDY